MIEGRKQVGSRRPVIDNQGVAFKLADMSAALMRGEPLNYRNGEGSMAKLKAGEVAVRVTEEAIQILGGNG